MLSVSTTSISRETQHQAKIGLLSHLIVFSWKVRICRCAEGKLEKHTRWCHLVGIPTRILVTRGPKETLPETKIVPNSV